MQFGRGESKINLAARLAQGERKMTEDIVSADYFSDYVCVCEKDVRKMDYNGIFFVNGARLLFEECADTFAEITQKQKTNCMGERDKTELCFMLYTPVHPTMLRFTKKPWFTALFSKPVRQRFYRFQQAIEDKGFSAAEVSEKGSI